MTLHEAKGLVYFIAELLTSGWRFGDLVNALCESAVGEDSAYCRNWYRDSKDAA
jgi:hypothetical protein